MALGAPCAINSWSDLTFKGMHTVIVVQFYHPDDGAIVREQIAFSKALRGVDVHLTFRNIFNDVWPWVDPVTFLEGACGIILGGSTALFDGNLKRVAGDHNDALFAHDRMKDLLHYISEHDVPTLGICFGHQLLAEYHGAPIVRDTAQAKIGTHEVMRAEQVDDDCLFSCLPETFYAQYIHKDAVTELPRGAHVVAHGARCNYAALRYGKNRYTVQFHPEFDHHHMQRVATAHPDYVQDLSPVDSLVIEESPHTAAILRGFVARCKAFDYHAV